MPSLALDSTIVKNLAMWHSLSMLSPIFNTNKALQCLILRLCSNTSTSSMQTLHNLEAPKNKYGSYSINFIDILIFF